MKSETPKLGKSESLDPYHSSRPYWVWWEGSEPIACTEREAVAQLWCAFLCGSSAKFQDQRHTYAVKNEVYKSDLLRREDFEKLDAEARKYILNDLQNHRLEHLRGCVAEVLNDFPKFSEKERGEDRHLYLGSVECYAETIWALRRDHTKFTIGINTGDDFVEVLETPAHLQAAVKFAALCFEEKAKSRLEALQ